MITEKNNKNTLLPVTGMSCAACASSVESMLNSTTGVSLARVNFATSMVDISFDPGKINLSELKDTIQTIGYDLIIEDEEDEKQAALAVNKANAYRQLVKKTVVSLLFTLPIMIISMGFPELAFGNIIMLILTLPVVFWSGSGFYSRAFLQLRYKMVTMDTLVALSTSIAFLYSLFVTVWPDFINQSGLVSHVYYEASAVIISFVLLGKLLEERAKSNTSSAIKKLMKLQPEIVTIVLDDETTEDVPIKSIMPGMRLLVKPGEQVPIDGSVISGASFVDESMITGEAIPAQKDPGGTVYAGTINQQGKLIIEATTIGSETMLAKIIHMVQKAQGSKAEVQKLADRIASVFVPLVLGIALLTFITWMLIGGDNKLTYGLITSISVLVIACPCALGLATPTAIMVGLGRGAEHNILIKDVAALEILNKVNTLVFDKTGTITKGKPEVTGVIWHNQEIIEEDIAAYGRIIHQLESFSSHPFSLAITRYFKNVAAPIEVTDFENIPGRGLLANYKNRNVVLGNARHLQDNGIPISTESKNEPGSIVYFAMAQQHIATITIADQLRPGVEKVISKLHNAGFTTWLLTGDNENTAKAISYASGITNYLAGLLPQDKADFITQLKQKGQTVAMIGDGINDSEALALADVGIAMGSGSDIAIEVAQITLKSDNISLIEQAIGLSEQTSNTIKQNLFWAFIYNLIGIPVAAGILYSINGFLLNPMIAAGAMALSSVSVVTNSLLLKKRPLKLKRRKQVFNNDKKMTTFRFKTNINCNGCIAAVTPKLEAVSELKSWHVDTDNPDKILTVELDNSKSEKIKEAVSSAGFTIEKI